ncbi:hypothetical protein JS82_06105 [Methanomassiliicoccaceae archaeon DOK]|nr:hypothetical protein JS82_06105 [Methanomassiliicoccaceae archaeon DOK]
MNHPAKITAILVLAILIAVTAASVSPSNDAAVQTHDLEPEDGNALIQAITDNSYGTGDTVNITLGAGIEYVLTFTESQGEMTFNGKNLNITSDGSNPATIKIESSGTVNSVIIQVKEANHSSSNLTVSNVTFASNTDTESAEVLHRYFWNVTFYDCTFNNSALTRTLGGNDTTTGGVTTITNCKFNGPGNEGHNTLSEGKFAVTTNSGCLEFQRNVITGYDRGLNAIINQNDDGRYLVVSNNKFTDLGVTDYQKPMAFQFGGDLQDMEIIFSINELDSVKYGVSVHNSVKSSDSTQLLVAMNTFSNVINHVLYSGSGEAEPIVPVPVLGLMNLDADNDYIELSYGFEDASQSSTGISITNYGPESLDWFMSVIVHNLKAFTLNSATDLLTLSLMVNAGQTFADCTLTLGSDIDLSRIDWIPIGNPVHPFTGSFSGNDGTTIHTITGLTIDKMESQGDVYAGLFGYIVGAPNNKFTSTSDVYNDGNYSETAVDPTNYTATVQDLVISNASIDTTGSRVGALAGYADNTYISGVTVTNGHVFGGSTTGGVIGIGYSVVLKECSTKGTFYVSYQRDTDAYNVGGIAGCIRGNTGHPSLVTGCVNEATVTARANIGGLGGIIGHINGSVPVVVYGCENRGYVASNPMGEIDNPYDGSVGGIVGFFQGSYGTTAGENVIANSKNYGKVMTTSGSKLTGNLSGIVGEYYSGSIVNCHNHGTIEGSAIFVGGIMGHGAINDRVVIDGCTNSGELTNSSQEYSENVSGIAVSATVIDVAEPDRRDILYRNMTFDTTEDLLNAMPKTGMESGVGLNYSGVAFSMEDVVVLTPGPLDLPDRVFGFTADTQVATSITMGSETTNTSVAKIFVPGVTVTIDGEYNSVWLNGDGFDLTNNGDIGTIRVYGGDGIIIRNESTVGEVTDAFFNGYNSTIQSGYSGCASITIYNGSTDPSSAIMNNVTSLYLNTELYNYGTIESGENLLRVGVECDETPVEQNNTFVVHNHGEMIGERTGEPDEQYNYMFFIPAAKKFTLINYEGSNLVNNGACTSSSGSDYWFIYYGTDGHDSSDDPSSDVKGTMEFYLADDTVLKNNAAYPDTGKFDTDCLKSLTVGKNNPDVDIKVQALSADDGSVTFSDGFDDSETVPLVNGSPINPPEFTKGGLNMVPWDIDAYEDGETYTAQWTVAPFTPTIKVDVENPVVGQTVNLTASFFAYPYLAYACVWTVGGEILTGSTVAYTVKDISTEVVLKISVTAADGYDCITETYTTSDVPLTLTATEPSVYEVTFDVNVDGYDVDVTDPDGTPYTSENGTYMLPDGDYTAIFTKSGYVDKTIDFTVNGKDEVIPVKMEPEAIDPEPGPDEPTDPDTPSIDPGYPTIDPDDDYVPLPPVVVDESGSSDDDTVKIVACAAAAVVAALMAAFLIISRRD